MPKPKAKGDNPKLLDYSSEHKPSHSRTCWFCKLPPQAHADLAAILRDNDTAPMLGQPSASMTIPAAGAYFAQEYGYIGTPSAMHNHVMKCLRRQWVK